MSLDLKKFYRENNFNFDKNLAYGIYKQRPISISKAGLYYVLVIAFNSQLTRELGSQMNDKVKEIKAKHRVIQNAITTNVSLEIYMYDSYDINDEFSIVLDECIDVVSMFIYPVCDTCPLCGLQLPSDAPFLRIRSYAIQAHDHCIDNLFKSTGRVVQNANSKSKTWMSIIIMLINLLVVIGLICLSALGSAYLWLSAVAGWIYLAACRFLFFRFKVLFDKPKIIAVSITSIICLMLSIYLGSLIFISINSTNTFIQAMIHYVEILKENYESFTKYLIYDSIFGLIMAGFSIFSLIRLSRNISDKVYKIENK